MVTSANRTNDVLEAASLGDMGRLRRLLDRSEAADQANPWGFTPLMAAVDGEHLDCAALLVDRGATPNATTVDAVTPLCIAARVANLSLVRLLLDAGATAGIDAAQLRAVEHGDPELVGVFDAKIRGPLAVRYFHGLLRRKGRRMRLVRRGAEMGIGGTVAEVYAVDKRIYANAKELAPIADSFVEPLGAHGFRGRKSAHFSCFVSFETDPELFTSDEHGVGNGSFVQLELDQRVLRYSERVHWALCAKLDQDSTNELLFETISRRRPREVEVLAGVVTLEAHDAEGRTPLLAAAHLGLADICEVLLELGVDPNAIDARGRNAETLALAGGHSSLAKKLGGKNQGAEEDVGILNSSLLDAVRAARFDTLAELLTRGADPNARTAKQSTPLMWASRFGRIDAIDTLLAKGAEIDACDSVGQCALFLAGSLEAAQRLIDQKADLEIQTAQGASPLIKAASKKQLDMAEALLNAGACPDAAAKTNGWTPLHWAAYQGDDAMAALLLQHGAACDLAENSGWTALMLAARGGHLTVAERLLSMGASIDAVNLLNETALFLAAEKGRKEMLEVLIDRGASLEVADNEGRTPLLIAAEIGHAAIVLSLVSRGADIGARDHANRSALILAYRGNFLDLGRTLSVETGCSVETFGMTALTAAVARGPEAVEARLSAENVDLVDESSWTALHWAAHLNRQDVAALLIERGASVEILDHREKSARDVALEATHESLAKSMDRLVTVRTVAARDLSADLACLTEQCALGHVDNVRLLLSAVSIPEHLGKQRHPLLAAVQEQQLEIVELLLARGVDPLCHDPSGESSLGLAAQTGNHAMIEMLLEAGSARVQADPALDWRLKESMRSAVVRAVSQFDVQTLGLVEKFGLDLGGSWVASEIFGAFYQAITQIEGELRHSEDSAQAGKPENASAEPIEERLARVEGPLRWLLDKGSPLEPWQVKQVLRSPVARRRLGHHVCQSYESTRTDIQDPLLFITLETGYEAGTMALLDDTTDVDQTSQSGDTALHVAARHCPAAMVETLLSRNFDPLARNHGGDTPLSLAAARWHPDVLRMLVESAEARPEAKSCFEQALFRASNEKTIAALLEAGADILCEYGEQGTLLMAAARRGDDRVVDALLRGGAALDQQCSAGTTALFEAVEARQPAVAALLIARGASVDLEGPEGLRALHMAARTGDESLVELLVRSGAKADERAISEAVQGGHIEAAEQLGSVQGEPIHGQLASEMTQIRLWKAVQQGDAKKVAALAADMDLSESRIMQGAARGNSEEIAEILFDCGAPLELPEPLERPLVIAARVDSDVMVRWFLARGVEPTAPGADGQTPLIAAAGHRSGSVIPLLRALESRPDLLSNLDARDEAGSTALMRAAEHAEESILRRLLAAGADPTLRRKDDATALQLARAAKMDKNVVLLERATRVDLSGEDLWNGLKKGVVGDVGSALRAGVSAETPEPESDMLPLAMVARSSRHMISLLLSYGADINARDNLGKTALHYYASWPTASPEQALLDSMSYLLERGADVNARDNEGRTPLYDAKHPLVMQALLDAGANPDLAGPCSQTPLYRAANFGHLEATEVLLCNGADPNLFDELGRSVLVGAINKGDERVVSALLSRGADPNLRSPNGGYTALHTSCGQENIELVRMLLGADAQAQARTDAGATVLHEALWRGTPELIKLLLDSGVDPAVEDASGRSAADVARQANRGQIVALLEGASYRAPDIDWERPHAGITVIYAVLPRHINLLEMKPEALPALLSWSSSSHKALVTSHDWRPDSFTFGHRFNHFLRLLRASNDAAFRLLGGGRTLPSTDDAVVRHLAQNDVRDLASSLESTSDVEPFVAAVCEVEGVQDNTEEREELEEAARYLRDFTEFVERVRQSKYPLVVATF